MTIIGCLWSQVKVDVGIGRDSCPEFIKPSRVEKRDGLYNFSNLHLEVAGFPYDENPVSQALSDLGGGLLPDSPSTAHGPFQPQPDRRFAD